MAKGKIKFSTIEGNSKGFWALAAVLTLLVLAGVAGSLMRQIYGHQISGMSNQVPWTFMKVIAIYFIGLSAGSLVLSALSSVFGIKEFKPLARISAVIAAILLFGSLVSIILVWGRPDRIVYPYFYWNFRSIYSLNGILYPSYIAICFFYLWAMITEREKLVTVIALVAISCAVLVHSATGAIFSFVGARELYHSPLLPPSFIAAALSSGTALMILILVITFKSTGRELDYSMVKKLARYLAGFIIIVTYFITVENINRFYFPKNYEVQHFLLMGGDIHTWLFWLGMVGCGNIFPLIILLYPKTGNSFPWILAACTLVVVGVLAERYIIVIPGQVVPLDLFPGYDIVSDFQDGVIDDYRLSLVETVQGVGLASMIGLIYIFFLKFFPLMPEDTVFGEEALDK
ncbi:MAG: NrfD/PsrC family molybdoenzyme membrane anchor subunit [Nitrospinota bacterium]